MLHEISITLGIYAMSKLLPKNSVVTLSTGEVVSVRPLTAFELLSHARLIADKLKSLEGDIDVLSLVIDVVTTHKDEVAQLLALSCTKGQSWAETLMLDDFIAIAIEVVSVNISAQKKTPALLAQLVAKLNMS